MSGTKSKSEHQGHMTSNERNYVTRKPKWEKKYVNENNLNYLMI